MRIGLRIACANAKAKGPETWMMQPVLLFVMWWLQGQGWHGWVCSVQHLCFYNYFFISLFQVLLSKVVNQNKIDEIQLRHWLSPKIWSVVGMVRGLICSLCWAPHTSCFVLMLSRLNIRPSWGPSPASSQTKEIPQTVGVWLTMMSSTEEANLGLAKGSHGILLHWWLKRKKRMTIEEKIMPTQLGALWPGGGSQALSEVGVLCHLRESHSIKFNWSQAKLLSFTWSLCVCWGLSTSSWAKKLGCSELRIIQREIKFFFYFFKVLFL